MIPRIRFANPRVKGENQDGDKVMATWKGKPKEFKVEFVNKDPSFWDLTTSNVTFKWEYNTTCDTLNVIAKHPEMEPLRELYSPKWAAAYIYTMADWMATYEGLDKLKELLKPILEKEDP